MNNDILNKYAEQYRISEDLPIGFAVIDKDMNVLFWNRTLVEWTGKSKTEMYASKISDTFTVLRQVEYSERMQTIFSAGPPVVFSSQLHNALIPSLLPNKNPRMQNTCILSEKSLVNPQKKHPFFPIYVYYQL